MALRLNVESAKKADVASMSINESGVYVGVFTRAEKLTARSGAEGIGFSFKSNDGESANYLDIYTNNGDKEFFGAQIVNSILVCMGMRGADDGQIEVIDWSGQKKIAAGYPQLMNKPIGLILRRELYTKNDGSDGSRMIVAHAFNASNNLTATEILNRETEPNRIKKFIKSIERNPVSDKRENKSNERSNPANKNTSYASQQDDFNDDDIPF